MKRSGTAGVVLHSPRRPHPRRTAPHTTSSSLLTSFKKCGVSERVRRVSQVESPLTPLNRTHSLDVCTVLVLVDDKIMRGELEEISLQRALAEMQ
jgi:hypothetical protein